MCPTDWWSASVGALRPPPFPAEQADSARGSEGFVMDRLQNEVNHNCRCGDDGGMVHRMRVHPRLHAIGHEALRVWNDHPVPLGDEKPTRAVLPKGTLDGDADAGRGDRSL